MNDAVSPALLAKRRASLGRIERVAWWLDDAFELQFGRRHDPGVAHVPTDPQAAFAAPPPAPDPTFIGASTDVGLARDHLERRREFIPR